MIARSGNENPQRYDGDWWLSAAPEEQLGYLNGSTDCAMWDLGVKIRYNRSTEEDQRYVTEFYRRNSDQRSKPILEIQKAAWETPGATKPEGGEHWTEPHGYWNGDWWTQSSSSERLGFVEGYLSCYAEKASKTKAKFSKAAQQYVEELNRWYRVDDPPPIPLKITQGKVARVLFRFRDRDANPSPKARK